MAILRNKTQDNFTIITNNILKDRELSLKGRGLLCTMLSLPDNWDFSEAGLTAILKDGSTSVRSALKELVDLGYLRRTRLRDDKGRVSDYLWEVSNVPEFADRPEVENANLDNANLENRIQLSTKEVSTNESTTNKEIKHKHGEYKNVLLTDQELSKLQDEFPDWQERIERLSEYIASKGAKYKSHYATIRAWARKDKKQPSKPSPFFEENTERGL